MNENGSESEYRIASSYMNTPLIRLIMHHQNDRNFVLMGGKTWALLALLCLSVHARAAAEVVRIGGRLEPKVDEFLIERMSEGARLELHRPTRREIVFETDAA